MKHRSLLLIAGILAVGASSPAMAYPYRHYNPHYYYGYHHGIYYEAPYAYYPAYPAYPVQPVPAYVYEAPAPVAQPVRPLLDEYADESYCREYQGHVSVGGRTEPVYGTACQQPDGSWKIIN